MKTLHIFKTEPDEETKILAELMSEGEESKQFELYKGDANYEQLIDLVFEHDKVVTWW
ncbi:MAG: hypothetical protein IMF11_13375 [Proteobacteria bacterium]|nr:hypothetical protein [Pseudomonadota bacterium]